MEKTAIPNLFSPTPQQMTPALIHHLVDTTAAIFGITPDQVRSSSR